MNKKKQPAVLEKFLQEACAKYLRGLMIEGLVLFNHAPNEGKRSLYGNMALRRQGMMPGWPDLDVQIIKGPGEHWPRVFIELKREGGDITDNQDECHARLRVLGYQVHVVKAAMPLEAVTKIKAILRDNGLDI